MINLKSFIPELVIDARYAATDNFLNTAFYPRNQLYLTRHAAKRLKRVSDYLVAQHLRLKVWDAYRPHGVQKKMWEIIPNPQYVADPAKGSKHNRGCAVDVTLVDEQGRELEMPTGFDDFSERAHHDYTELPPKVLKNRALLKDAMTRFGFEIFSFEWWHYEDPDWEHFPILNVDPWQKG